MTRVAIYARYSTERQSESSIADQLRVCTDYATQRAWRIVERYTDEGISGAAFGNRPGARAMETLALGGGCDVILLVDLTRLSRSTGDLAKFLERMRFRRVRVLGVQDGFDSSSRTARMQAGLSGIMSEEFRAVIADRTHSAMLMRAEAGQATGGRAYGSTEDERRIVVELFERFAAGESFKALASDLNRRGVPSPGSTWKRAARATHGRWLVSALHALLQNERYAGRLIYNRSRWEKDPDSGKRKRTERPQHEWIVQEVPAIVDPDLWAAAQMRFAPGKGRGGPGRYLLSGLLECGICGSKFIVVGGSQHRYTCGTYHGGGAHACANRLTVPRAIAEQRILRTVQDDLLSPGALAIALREMRQVARENVPAVDPQVAQLERMVREGLLDAAIAAPAIAEARRRAPVPAVQMPSERAWRQTVEQMREVLQGEDVIAARETLRELLGPIRLRPGEGHMVAELTARQLLLQTGSGRWVGSGGPLLIQIPTSSRLASP